MNLVVKELASKSTLQQFILTLLDDVEKYFKAAQPLAQDKAIATLQTIFARVHREFPLIASIPNIAKRITKNLKQKIVDRTDKGMERKKVEGLKSFIEGIQDSTEEEELSRGNSEENQDNIQTWIKKTLIQCVVELKEDIRQADEGTVTCLKTKLSRETSSVGQKPLILFVDSFITNESAVRALKGYQVLKVMAKPNSKEQISIMQGASYLRGAKLVILSADAVLRNGGVLCTSGGLMLAVAARQLGVPVLAVSRSYCLWEHIICGQESLVQSSSGRAWLGEEEGFRVCIGKGNDYVGPELIKELLGQGADWQNRSIVEIFEDYYQ